MRARHDRHAARVARVIALQVVEVRLGIGVGVEASVLDVADDADDFEPARSVELERNPPADRILAGPVPPRRRFVDDDDVGCVASVAVAEVAAADERDPKSR